MGILDELKKLTHPYDDEDEEYEDFEEPRERSFDDRAKLRRYHCGGLRPRYPCGDRLHSGQTVLRFGNCIDKTAVFLYNFNWP